MDYISIKQLSERWGISTRRIQILCRDGRIPGVMWIANTWAIPADAKKQGRQSKKWENIKGGFEPMTCFEIIIAIVNIIVSNCYANYCG